MGRKKKAEKAGIIIGACGYYICIIDFDISQISDFDITQVIDLSQKSSTAASLLFGIGTAVSLSLQDILKYFRKGGEVFFFTRDIKKVENCVTEQIIEMFFKETSYPNVFAQLYLEILD